jgi:hypothetical protein
VGKQEVFLLFAEVLDDTMTIESVSAKELYANLLQLSFRRSSKSPLLEYQKSATMSVVKQIVASLSMVSVPVHS